MPVTDSMLVGNRMTNGGFHAAVHFAVIAAGNGGFACKRGSNWAHVQSRLHIFWPPRACPAFYYSPFIGKQTPRAAN